MHVEVRESSGGERQPPGREYFNTAGGSGVLGMSFGVGCWLKEIGSSE